MSTSTKISLEEQRSRLERRANVIRSRLLRTIDALDTRRHQVEELGHHAKRLARPVAATVAGAAVVVIGAAFVIRAIVEHRRERRFSYRLSKALAPFREPVKPPLWKEALRKVTLSVLGILASEAAKRGVHQLVHAPNELPLLGGPAHDGDAQLPSKPPAPALLGT